MRPTRQTVGNCLLKRNPHPADTFVTAACPPRCSQALMLWPPPKQSTIRGRVSRTAITTVSIDPQGGSHATTFSSSTLQALAEGVVLLDREA